MASKLRQLGWICVNPTPPAQACAEAGKSVRRVVAPRNTIRTVATVDRLGDAGRSSQATNVALATNAAIGSHVCTSIGYWSRFAHGRLRPAVGRVEQENVRAALEWALTSAPLAEKGVEFAGALFWFWTKLGRSRRAAGGSSGHWRSRLTRRRPYSTLTSTTSQGVKFYSDEDPTGSQAREVELERSGT